MYTGAIIGYLSWPFMIWVSYIAVRWALRYFEKHHPEAGHSEAGLPKD